MRRSIVAALTATLLATALPAVADYEPYVNVEFWERQRWNNLAAISSKAEGRIDHVAYDLSLWHVKGHWVYTVARYWNGSMIVRTSVTDSTYLHDGLPHDGRIEKERGKSLDTAYAWCTIYR